MATVRLPRKEFEALAEAVRENLPDRINLIGWPEKIRAQIQVHDPSPGQAYWTSLEIEPKSPVEEGEGAGE